MNYDTLRIHRSPGVMTAEIHRPQNRNSMNHQLLKELNNVLDEAERDPACRMVALRGCGGVFCTGMDFDELVDGGPRDTAEDELVGPPLYLHTLKRFTLSPVIVAAVVEGEVTAGGVGLVAAADIAIGTPDSRFALSEALWGLLPAIVTPFLIRRCGFQAAYRMTLTTMPVSGDKAFAIGLLDECGPDVDEILRRLFLRLNKVEESTVGNLKRYFRKMWMITEEMERTAVEEISRLGSDPRVTRNIENFVKHGKMPWD